jgi:hypothetical protein
MEVDSHQVMPFGHMRRVGIVILTLALSLPDGTAHAKAKLPGADFFLHAQHLAICCNNRSVVIDYALSPAYELIPSSNTSTCSPP